MLKLLIGLLIFICILVIIGLFFALPCLFKDFILYFIFNERDD